MGKVRSQTPTEAFDYFYLNIFATVEWTNFVLPVQL